MFEYLKSYIRTTERIILIAAIAASLVFCKLYNMEKETRENQELAENILPANLLARYIIKNRELVQAVRDAQGKVHIRTVYVPDEGKIEVLTKQKEELFKKYQILINKILNTKDLNELTKLKQELGEILDEINKPPEIIITNKGFTSRFGYGLIIGPGLRTKTSNLTLPLLPVLDWKWFYWERWSLTGQINPEYFGPGITRHIDDFTPGWLKMKNIELGLTGGWKWQGGNRVDIYLRSNF